MRDVKKKLFIAILLLTVTSCTQGVSEEAINQTNNDKQTITERSNQSEGNGNNVTIPSCH